jgi:hypothetical protein
MRKENMSMGNQFEERFDSLLADYKRSMPDAEISANFSPLMWKRIEARKAMTFSFERLAQKFVTAAIAMCMMMALFLVMPMSQTSALTTYIEALSEEHETMAYSDVTPTDPMMQQVSGEREN